MRAARVRRGAGVAGRRRHVTLALLGGVSGHPVLKYSWRTRQDLPASVGERFATACAEHGVATKSSFGFFQRIKPSGCTFSWNAHLSACDL